MKGFRQQGDRDRIECALNGTKLLKTFPAAGRVPAAQFKQLDTDGEGLLSPGEASQVESRD
jgi:hypothetical protein